MSLTLGLDGKLRVLVADDIESARKELLELVRDLGHETIEAVSGEDALRLMDSHSPDVILLDLLMPGMDGFQVVKEIRKLDTGKWLPVIVLSSLDGSEHFAKALQNGATDYLPKPVRPAILRAKLRQYLRILSMQSNLGLLAQRQHAVHEHIADAIVTNAIHENIADTIVTINEQGLISDLNRAARRIFQVEDAEVASGMSIFQLTGLSLDFLLNHAEVEILLRTGQQAWFQVMHNSWSIGSSSYFTLSLHDLTEAKRIERMKDEFLATVSHELRTPLTSILGALGLLTAGAGGLLPSAAIELVQVAKRNGYRLSRLIDDVLDLTKLEGNSMRLNVSASALPTLIEEAVVSNISYAQGADLRIEFESRGPSFQVQVDPDRFLQIMANLLSNAIKHSPKGGLVHVVLEADASYMHVRVIDQGPGIDKEFKTKLFEKFSQADTSDRRALSGTGLGLYICRMLVEKMKGNISAESGATGGATFTVSLPRIITGDENPWVLCIAQDRQLQERMQEWLSGLARVELANHLESAAEIILRMGTPKLVLADPKGQGLADQFCERLLQLVGAKRILLTGDALDADFAAGHGLEWLSLSRTPRLDFVNRTRILLSEALKD
jgi:signal transduction histidine kinase